LGAFAFQIESLWVASDNVNVDGARVLDVKNYDLAFVLLAGGQSARYGGNKLLSEHPISKLPLIEHSLRVLLDAKASHSVALINSAVTKTTNQERLAKQSRVTVVAGKWHGSIDSHLRSLPVNVVHNTLWEEGIASSIRAGLKHVLSTPTLPPFSFTCAPEDDLESDERSDTKNEESAGDTKPPSHVLISLADLACLTEQDIANLIHASQANPENIVCCEWQNNKERGQGGHDSHPRLTVPAIFPNAMFAELLSLKGDVGAKPVISEYLKKGRVTTVPTPNAQFDIDSPQDWVTVALSQH